MSSLSQNMDSPLGEPDAQCVTNSNGVEPNIIFGRPDLCGGAPAPGDGWCRRQRDIPR